MAKIANGHVTLVGALVLLHGRNKILKMVHDLMRSYEVLEGL